MPDLILDGKGRGNRAAVNDDGQLITRATAVKQRLHSAIDENYMEFTTGQIELTDANETMISYVENEQTDSDIVLVIDRVLYDVWASTGGSGDGTLKYYRNPTITGGTDVDSYNTNFGSNQTNSITCKKSLTTMTGDVWWTAGFLASNTYALEEGRIIIPSGYSFGISIQAPSSNSSMKISVNIEMFVLDKNLIQ